jgi:hypothetical protein
MNLSTSAGAGGFTAFAGDRRLTGGALADVAVAVRKSYRRRPEVVHHVFEDGTGHLMELDLRGTDRDVRRRIKERFASRDGAGDGVNREEKLAAVDRPTSSGEAVRGPGRPRLGVVAREVTLLPRHWEWLNEQPGGASVVLRRLVEDARKSSGERDRRRRSQEGAYRFMRVMAGDREGFEEATRALFAGDGKRFDARTASWPDSIRDYTRFLAGGAFEAAPLAANPSGG